MRIANFSLLVAALFGATAARAQSPETPDPTAGRLVAYHGCIAGYTEQAMKSPGPPSDIAAIAETKCKSLVAAPSGNEIVSALAAHRACAITYAERLANTNEAPGDIATAAMPSCRVALGEFLGRTQIPVSAHAKLIRDMEQIAYDLALRAVLEKRYPNQK